MHYMIYRTKCKVYITKNNKYITLCEKDYYVWVNSKLRMLNWNPSFQFVSLSSDLANRLHK